MTREELWDHAERVYGSRPEYLWASSPNTAILRRGDTGKWFAALLDVPRARLGLPGEGRTDLLNLKCGPELMGSLRIGLLLEGPVSREELIWLLAISYELAIKQRKGSSR